MDATERLAAAAERIADHLDAQRHAADIEAAARAEVRKAPQHNDGNATVWTVLWLCVAVLAVVLVVRQPAESDQS